MHKITNINEEKKTGICSKCGEVPVKLVGLKKNGDKKWSCRILIRKHDKKYCESPNGSFVRRKNSLKKKTSILSKIEFEKFQKTNECEICGSQNNEKSLHIDHCHTTGKIRGFLCVRCNLGLGYFKDSISTLISAASYLKERTHQNRPVSSH